MAPLPRRLVAVALVAASLFLLPSCETTTVERDQVVAFVNKQRRAAGLPALRLDLGMSKLADDWSVAMGAKCNISHKSPLDMPAGSTWAGENVGMGGTIDATNAAFMNSPGHKANILSWRATRIGVGAVWRTCNGRRQVFITQRFANR